MHLVIDLFTATCFYGVPGGPFNLINNSFIPLPINHQSFMYELDPLACIEVKKEKQLDAQHVQLYMSR